MGSFKFLWPPAQYASRKWKWIVLLLRDHFIGYPVCPPYIYSASIIFLLMLAFLSFNIEHRKSKLIIAIAFWILQLTVRLSIKRVHSEQTAFLVWNLRSVHCIYFGTKGFVQWTVFFHSVIIPKTCDIKKFRFCLLSSWLIAYILEKRCNRTKSGTKEECWLRVWFWCMFYFVIHQ